MFLTRSLGELELLKGQKSTSLALLMEFWVLHIINGNMNIR